MSRATEACVSPSLAVLVVQVAGFLCSVLAGLRCGYILLVRALVAWWVPLCRFACAVVADWRFACPGLP